MPWCFRYANGLITYLHNFIWQLYAHVHFKVFSFFNEINFAIIVNAAKAAQQSGRYFQVWQCCSSWTVMTRVNNSFTYWTSELWIWIPLKWVIYMSNLHIEHLSYEYAFRWNEWFTWVIYIMNTWAMMQSVEISDLRESFIYWTFGYKYAIRLKWVKVGDYTYWQHTITFILSIWMFRCFPSNQIFQRKFGIMKLLRPYKIAFLSSSQNRQRPEWDF